MIVEGVPVKVTGKVVKTARLENEWLDCVAEPVRVIGMLAQTHSGVDCFTFRQKPGETEPGFSYPMEWESLAVIPVTGYEEWLDHQINSGAKRAVKKAQKKGVEVKIVEVDEQVAAGISNVVNETPVRQGRPYMHYGKTPEVLKAELCREAARNTLIAAFLKGELIGFIQLGHGDGWVVPFGMISMIRHRDKSPQNALLAKTVEICAERGIRYILYGNWSGGGLGDFKRNNGCVEMRVPRYYAPISLLGKIACRLRFYKGLKGVLPESVLVHAQDLRRRWYGVRFGTVKE